MEEQKERLRVSYRFNPETVALLKKAQRQDKIELYNRRSITWLLEYAVRQQFRDVAVMDNGSE